MTHPPVAVLVLCRKAKPTCPPNPAVERTAAALLLREAGRTWWPSAVARVCPGSPGPWKGATAASTCAARG